MLALRDHAPSTGTYEVTLPAEANSPRLARAAVAQQCAAWGLGRLCEEASLLVSELVGNAVRHAGTVIHVTLVAFVNGLRLEVTDGSGLPLRPQGVTLQAEGGRGLAIVDALATHHGVEGHPHGKTVWAELSWTR
jgi:anti-sigma regulatory factor (Ser/Thr protein kinase)